MTEIQHYQPTELAAVNPTASMVAASDEAFTRLQREMELMGQLYNYAKQLCSSQFVPEIYRDKPENGAAAMQYGANFGLTGMASLQNVFLVKGKPSTFSRVMYAAVLAAGHELWEAEGTDESVTWTGHRAGSDKTFTSTWTMERAKKAGYLSNAKYASNPMEMLRAKCQAEVCRTIAPDVLMGMPYSVEELEMEPLKVKSRRMDRPARGVAGLAAALAEPASNPVPKPDTEQVNSPAPVAEPAGPAMATFAQQKRMAAVLDGEKLTTKASKLEYLQGQFGDHIKSAADVTTDQAEQLISYLTDAQAKDAAVAREGAAEDAAADQAATDEAAQDAAMEAEAEA